MDYHDKINIPTDAKWGDNIIEILDKKIQNLTRESWSFDGCKPDFLISVLKDTDTTKIILTVRHLNRCLSTVLFPSNNSLYDYDSLEKIMTDLYNQTM